MARALDEILNDIGTGPWGSSEAGPGRPPCSAERIASARAEMRVALPSALVTFYSRTDGLEQGGGAHVEIEPLEETLALTRERPELPDGAILIGSDCGLWEVIYDSADSLGHGRGAIVWKDCQQSIDTDGATDLCAASLEEFLELYLRDAISTP